MPSGFISVTVRSQLRPTSSDPELRLGAELVGAVHALEDGRLPRDGDRQTACAVLKSVVLALQGSRRSRRDSEKLARRAALYLRANPGYKQKDAIWWAIREAKKGGGTRTFESVRKALQKLWLKRRSALGKK